MLRSFRESGNPKLLAYYRFAVLGPRFRGDERVLCYFGVNALVRRERALDELHPI
jgi:hypothetical protein